MLVTSLGSPPHALKPGQEPRAAGRREAGRQQLLWAGEPWPSPWASWKSLMKCSCELRFWVRKAISHLSTQQSSGDPEPSASPCPNPWQAGELLRGCQY